MKSHISATIDSTLAEEVNRYSQQEHRSRSQIIEMALEAFLKQHAMSTPRIITSNGSFSGSFNRSETYER